MRCEIGAIAFVIAFALAIWIDWNRLRDWPKNLQFGFRGMKEKSP